MENYINTHLELLEVSNNIDIVKLTLKTIDEEIRKIYKLIDECLIKGIDFAKEFPDLNEDYNRMVFAKIRGVAFVKNYRIYHNMATKKHYKKS